MNASKSQHPLIPLLQRRTIAFSIIGAILGLIVGLSAAKLRKPYYLTNLVLRVGEVGYVTNTGGLMLRSVENPRELVERLRYEHRLKGIIGREPLPLPYLHRARVSRSDKNLVTLEAHGSTEDEAIGFLRALSDKIISEHAAHLKEANNLRETRHAQVRKHLQVIDGVLDEQLKTLNPEPGETAQLHGLRLIQTGILTSHRANADRDVHLLNISRFYTTPTRILLEPKPDNAVPVGMSTKALGLVGALAGAFLGCFISFLSLWRRAAS